MRPFPCQGDCLKLNSTASTKKAHFWPHIHLVEEQSDQFLSEPEVSATGWDFPAASHFPVVLRANHSRFSPSYPMVIAMRVQHGKEHFLPVITNYLTLPL